MTIRSKLPALQRVLQIDHHDLIQHLRMHRRVFYRHHGFHAPIHIARHPISRGNINLGATRWQPMPIAEYVNARMFQKAANDGFHADVIRKPRHARAQAANAAHNGIHLHASLRSLIQRINQRFIHQRIHLDPNRRRLAFLGEGNFLADQREQGWARGER